MKICSVVGARPNFVKEYLINRELRERGVREVLIHTGQHYDYEMSQAFFDSFELPVPDCHLQVANTDPIAFTSRVTEELAQVFRTEAPDCVLGYGDVNSTMAAAIAATKLRLPFAHVEGGIRASDRYNPEEVNRRVSDVLSDVVFCCTQIDVDNLVKEGFEGRRIELTGDLMKDALLLTLKQHGIQPTRGDYHVLTLHRQENMEESRLRAIVDGVSRVDRKIVFPLHPRTRNRLKELGLLDELAKSRIDVRGPMGYVEFIRLAAGADKILTDSGGVRREAYLLRKPCIALIDLSWFPEIARAGWKVFAAADGARIAELVTGFEPTGPYQDLFGDGTAHRKIVGELVKRYSV